jgi:hypothetical protein
MKAPAFQFYVMDWMNDLDEHPLEIEGAWIRIICKLWRSEKRGELSKTILQWSRILRVDLEKAAEILDYIDSEKIGDIEFEKGGGVTEALHRNKKITDCNTKITVKSRRMVRDRIAKENNSLRQKRFRDKHKSNAGSNGKVTPPSSSSSSSSSSKKIQEQPNGCHIDNFKKPIQLGPLSESVKSKCAEINRICAENKIDFNPYKWVGYQVKKNGHPGAIVDSLAGLMWRITEVKNERLKSPWSYIEKIMKTKNGNYWEQENINRAKKQKMTEISSEFQTLIEGIG